MTRGKFVIITNDNDKVYSSIEFNGDMYYENNGHGTEAVERLKRVTDCESFEKEVAEFDKENFGYKDAGYLSVTGKLTFPVLVKNPTVPINLKASYFKDWFSDYLYVKNVSDKVQVIMDYKGMPCHIGPDQIKIFHFGDLYATVLDNGELSLVEN